MLAEQLCSDDHYQEEVLTQQKTLISALKEQILRLQDQLLQMSKINDEKTAQIDKMVQQIQIVKQKNETLKQNNESLLRTLQVFQREYIKRDYNNVLSLPSHERGKGHSDGPLIMQLIRNIKLRSSPQPQTQKPCQKSYLSEYYGYFFYSSIDEAETELYQETLLNHKNRTKKIRSYGRKKLFNQKHRHYFWLNLIDNNLRITESLYDLLNDRISANRENEQTHNTIIDMDLRRMDLKLDDEKSKSMKMEIKRCLQVFTEYRPDIGYIQGMSYLAWIFLMRMEGYQAFTSLANKLLGDPFVASLYLFNERNIKKIISFYEECLQDKKPKLSRHMKKLEVDSDLFVIEWAYTFFSRAFNLRLISKIWDLWLAEDFNVFFKVAMVILEMLEPELLELTENDKVIETLRTQTHRLDEDELIRQLQKQRLFQDLKLT